MRSRRGVFVWCVFACFLLGVDSASAVDPMWDTAKLNAAVWRVGSAPNWQTDLGPYPDEAAVYQAAYDWCRQTDDYIVPGLDCEPHPLFTDYIDFYDGGGGTNTFYILIINVYRGGGYHGNITAKWFPDLTTIADCPAGKTINYDHKDCVDPLVDNEEPPQPLQCGRSNPCNPADGSKRQVEIDYVGDDVMGLSFARYYNSKGAYKTGYGMGVGWRHTYSRSINETPDVAPTVRFAPPATQSSGYATTSDACASGWDDIKSDAFGGDLSGATATFVGGNICKVESGGQTVAYLPTRQRTGWLAGFTQASTIKTVTRPDGSAIIFEQDGANWVSVLNSAVSLVQSGTDWIFTDENDTQETYDSEGRLVEIKPRGKPATIVQYGSATSKRVSRVVGPYGHRIVFSYSDGLLTRVSTPVGQFDYGYTSNAVTKKLAKVRHPDVKTRTYHYEDPDYVYHLTGITDANGKRFATWAYDDAGRAILSEHAGSEVVQYTYNSDGSTTESSANGATRTYQFATERGQRLLGGISGDGCADCIGGHVASKSYDANGFVDEVVDKNGNTTQTIRNSRGLTETLVEAKGTSVERTTTTTWHTNFRLPTQVVRPNNTTTLTHDSDGRILSATTAAGPLSRTWSFTYNTYGEVTSIDGPRIDVSDVTTITYYPYNYWYYDGNEGQVKTITNALGHVTTFNTYDSAGRPTQITDPNGLKTLLSYDWRGNVKSVTLRPSAGADRVTSMTYDNAGQLKTMSTPDGMVLTYTYNDSHYVTSVTDNFSNRIDYAYDSMGNLSDQDIYDSSSTLKRAVDYAYDLTEQLDSITTGGYLTDLTFDVLGNLEDTTDPALASTFHTYDPLNRLEQTVDALSGIVLYDYDDHDNPTSIASANGAVTTYEYDDLDNLTKEISPDRGTLTYTYDEAGNRKTATDARGKVTSYDYDALNRLTLVTLDGGATIAYEYDVGGNAIGRVDKITDGSGTTTWSYSNFGEVSQKTQTIGSVALTTDYGYDAAGRLASMTYPSSKVVTYGYDTYLAISVTVDSTTVLSGATYDPMGPVNGWTWGNSSSASRTFDLRGLQTSIAFAGTAQGLGYDAAGQLTSQSDTILSLTYDYDLLGRVTDFGNTGGGSMPASQLFSYDANGNRNLLTENSVAYSYSNQSNSNRLLSTAGPVAGTYTYDASGNITGDGTNTFGYDDRGRLVSLNSGSATYVHNGQGQRVKKDNGAVTLFAYDEAGSILGEYDSAGAPINETVWFNGAPVAVLAGTVIYYVHTDHLGSPRVISDGGTVVWRWDSDPFGRTQPDEDPDGDSNTFTYNLRFSGQYYDVESGLYYNYFRTFDPSTGRYLESDPAGIAPGPNTYAYAWSNPLGFTDRFGLDPNIDLGQGYSGRVDQFDYKGQSSFEIHVFDKNGKEVGVYGPNGWINKHGHSGRPTGIPADVENQCKGKAVELGRRSSHIPDKGRGNIKGNRWKRFFSRAPLIGPLIEMTRPSPEHLCDIDPENEICAN